MTEIQNNLFGIKWPTGVDMPLNKTQTNWTYGEKAWRQLHKNAASNIEQVLLILFAICFTCLRLHLNVLLLIMSHN